MAKLTDPVTDSEHLLSWWHQHQTEWLVHEADAIRNGLLQDLFAMRRKLELLDLDDNACLAHMERLYQTLEALGNRLSSPFIHDSLPLAIQHTLSPLQATTPLRVTLPASWPAEPPELIRLLLSVLDYWLSHLGHMSPPPSLLEVNLAEAVAGKQLILRVEFTDTLPLALLTHVEGNDWTYHLSTFEILSRGTVQHRRTANTLEWQLCW